MNTLSDDINVHFISHFARTGSTFFSDRLSRNPEILIIPESKILRIIKITSVMGLKNGTVQTKFCVQKLILVMVKLQFNLMINMIVYEGRVLIITQMFLIN